MNFYNRVYDVVKEIPKGKVATYGQIAKILGAPKCSRAVGYALHQNPNNQIIPCHRVVNRFGKVSSGFAFGGPKKQQKLLELEGIIFDKENKIDLNKYGWKEELLDIK